MLGFCLTSLLGYKVTAFEVIVMTEIFLSHSHPEPVTRKQRAAELFSDHHSPARRRYTRSRGGPQSPYYKRYAALVLLLYLLLHQ